MNSKKDIEEFAFKYLKEIPLTKLEIIWDKIRDRDIQLSKIKAFTLSHKEYVKILDKLRKSPHIIDMAEEEWGRKNIISSACTFFSDVNKTWIILKCKGYHPLNEDLEYEIKHILDLS